MSANEGIARTPSANAAPSNLQAEQAVIGAILTNPNEWLDVCQAEIGSADEFFGFPSRCCWEAIRNLQTAREAITPATVLEWLKSRDAEDSKQMPAFLVECLESFKDKTKPRAMAKIVHAKFIARQLLRFADRVQKEAKHIGTDAAMALDDLTREIMEIGQASDQASVSSQEQAMKTAWELLDKRIKRFRSSERPEFRYGLPTLDRLTNGLHGGEFTVVGARPGVGKTIFAAHLAYQAALQGKPAFLVMLEQAKEEIVFRLASQHTEVSSFGMRSGSLTHEDEYALSAASSQMEGWPIFWSDNPHQTVMRICANARRERKRHGIEIVVIDYLQLMSGDNQKQKRWEQVGDMSRRLKLLSRELGIPVVAMAQLNRNAPNRTDQRPRMSDLREAGNLEQDADNVILLHPESKSNGDVDSIAVILEKQRNGPTGECLVQHHKRYFRIREFDEPLP